MSDKATSGIYCTDCGREYKDFGLDTVLVNEQWLMICPEGFDVLLCANCIVKRASTIKGVICAKMQLETKILDDYYKETLELREVLAELCHSQWAGWLRYMFSKGDFNKDGTWIMPSWAVERWQRQMNTPYDDLSEAEQESDKVEADKFLAVL